MPELPEVETTIRDLSKSQPPIIGAVFINVWIDSPKILQKPKNFQTFKKHLIGKKIKKIWRRGKNILIDLSDSKTLLIHQKLTGHLLIGCWILDNGYWKPKIKGSLENKYNSYIHLMFWLSNGKMLALSDLRKFAKIELWDKEELKKELELLLGPEPLDKDFTFNKFKQILSGTKQGIKQVLMDQKRIAGIGNIYSDEILWEAKVSPFKAAERLSNEEMKRVYQAIKKILAKAIIKRGTSISDYRDIEGKEGLFGNVLNAYQKKGEKCSRCGTKIKRKKIGNRSAHFCPKCQQ